MLFFNGYGLAKALLPILKNRVVIRYAVQTQRYVQYQAELAVLVRRPESDYLGRARFTLFVDDFVRIIANFESTDLTEKPDALSEMCVRWSQRRFNDWMHGEPFMGAYEIFLEGQPHTSVKLEATDERWRFLTGIIIGQLMNELQPKLEADREGGPQVTVREPDAQEHCRAVLMRRMSAFAAQVESLWARQRLMM